jgi:prepilin-type N-terminal cleavage/methylation domain-containing protein
MSIRSLYDPAGFTLIEAVVAAAILATAAATLAQLLAAATHQSARNRHALAATIAAQNKLQHLRAVRWTTTVDGLTASPPRSMLEDTAGFVDYPDRYVRRWSISRRDPLDLDTFILQVCVFRVVGRNPGLDACVGTVRARRP